MNFSLGKHLEAYVEAQVKAGRFNNASEVVRDALRLHEEHELKLADLRRDVQAGVDSIASGRTSRANAADIKQKARQRNSAR